MTKFTCPGCDHSDDLSKYQCSNCRKFGVMEVVDKSSPFHCENCDLSWVCLTCPKCSTRITEKFTGPCFVATASYMDPSHPDVIFLRSFRDNFLVNYKIGIRFIYWYWNYGPKLAVFVSKHELFRKCSKLCLQVIVSGLRKLFWDVFKRR